MAKLLHIQASPRIERSASIAVAKHFLDAYAAAHPDDTIETINLWDAPLPEFNGAVNDAKYAIMHGQSHTPEQLAAWQAVVDVADNFKSADKYLFSLPMWNFGIPYKLKHYIDVLTQPGLTFGFTPETGYFGLVTDKPAVIIYARGGAYATGSGGEALDFQSPYMRHFLNFIGFTDIKEIFVEPTLAGPTAKDEAVAANKQQAADIAAAL